MTGACWDVLHAAMPDNSNPLLCTSSLLYACHMRRGLAAHTMMTGSAQMAHATQPTASFTECALPWLPSVSSLPNLRTQH